MYPLRMLFFLLDFFLFLKKAVMSLISVSLNESTYLHLNWTLEVTRLEFSKGEKIKKEKK